MKSKSKLQVLVSTMNSDGVELYKRMNINSDAIIINQTDHYDYYSTQINGSKLEVFSYDEKGLGLSRETAICRSNADIIQIADDDMIFVDANEEIVLNEFRKHPEADAILFSKDFHDSRNKEHRKKFCRLKRIEAIRPGLVGAAFKKEVIAHNNLHFNTLFGGGEYLAGEDTLFLQDCLDAGLNIYWSPIIVADMIDRESSWYRGRDEEFYRSKGALIAAISPRLCKLAAFAWASKHYKENSSWKWRFDNYCRGINEYRQRMKSRKK